MEARLRVLLDKNLIKPTHGTSLRGATYKITSDGRQIYESEDGSNNMKLEELFTERDKKDKKDNSNIIKNKNDQEDQRDQEDQNFKYFDEIISPRIFLK